VPLHLTVAYTGGSASRDYRPGVGAIFSTDVPKAIPDNSSAGVASTLTLPAGGNISDLDVAVDVTHTFIGDVSLVLTSPDNTDVVLADRPGNGNNFGDDLTGTIFDDEASAAFDTAAAPFTGRFRPLDPLSAYDGKPYAGTWTLSAFDSFGGDTGSLLSWAFVKPCASTGNNAAPTTAISGPATATTGQSVTFSAAGSADSDGTVTSFEWDLDGNGSFETTTAADSVQTTFGSPGTFTVKVHAIDEDGGVSSPAETTITVSSPAAALPTPTATPFIPPATAKPVAGPTPVAGLLSGSIKGKSGAFTAPIAGCAGCKVVLVLKTAKKVAVKKGGRKKIVQIAKVTLTLDANGAGKAKFKLSKANKAMLKRLKKLALNATLTVTNPAGKTATSTGKLTIRA
jgi:subtilisin-like proprotein convertase family protein